MRLVKVMNKDVGMGLNDFLSLCRHLLVHLLFHEVTSLHTSSFQTNDFYTCSIHFSAWDKAPINEKHQLKC